jgi:transposase
MERIEMYKIRDMFRLLFECKQSYREISKSLNIGKSTVCAFANRFKKTALSYKDIQALTDTEILELLDIEKINKSDKYNHLKVRFPEYEKELKKTGVTIKLLWEEYIFENPSGYSLSQFCHHFQIWRGSSKTSMRLEHKAGDKMFVDFTGKHLYITDKDTGRVIPVEVFVAVLPSSSFTYAEASISQEKMNMIKCTENALWYFGGVPAAIVPDCLKSAVTRGCKYEPDINRDFLDFARHYQTAVLPARPYSPKDKAMVEGAVKIVYSWIFAKLRDRVFYSIYDLNKAIFNLLSEYNTKIMQLTKISRLEMFNQIEKNTLKPLPLNLYEPKMYAKLTVAFNYHIFLNKDKHYYSVPFNYIKKKVDVVYTHADVEIYYNNVRIACHRRSDKANGYTTIKEHMPENHKFYNEWSPERFISWAEKLGDDVKILIEKILLTRDHPEQAFKVSLGILNLAKRYGNEKLNKACRKAVYYDVYTLKFVKNALENNALEIESNDLFTVSNITHENIRGNQYFN